MNMSTHDHQKRPAVVVHGNQFSIKSLMGFTVCAAIMSAVLAPPIREVVQQPDGAMALAVGIGVMASTVFFAMGAISLFRFVGR